jgi:hypothetical protein
MQRPGLEYRLGLDADGQRYARWPAAQAAPASDSVVFEDDQP